MYETKKDKIISKKGKTYELDRASWSTYANIAQICGGVIDEFIDANVAARMAYSLQMDKDGLECEEEQAFGCKVTHGITDTSYIIILDEVSGNTSQKGDENIDG